MGWYRVRRAHRAPRCGVSRRALGVLCAILLAGTVAGCGVNMSAGSLTNSTSGATIAFESIDGPPPEVFRSIVARLNEAAQARQIAVVSRASPATYRIRGYVSAQVERGRTSLAWVWDIYDTDRRRALRITGDEPTGGDARSAWASADDQVLRRIASNGMDRVAAFLNEGAPPAGAQPEPMAGSIAEPAPSSVPAPRQRPGKPNPAMTGALPESIAYAQR